MIKQKSIITSNQEVKLEIGIGTIPEILNRVPFYIRMDVTPMRNGVRSSQTEMFVDKPNKNNIDKIERKLLIEVCGNQNWIIQKQGTQINELQNQLADYEQELYETWKGYRNIEQPSCLEEMA